jgi:hypothetical protein
MRGLERHDELGIDAEAARRVCEGAFQCFKQEERVWK